MQINIFTSEKGVIFILSENVLLKNDIELIETDEKFEQVAGWNKYFISNYGRLLHKNNKGNHNQISNYSL